MKRMMMLCAVVGFAACQQVSSELLSPEIQSTGNLTVCVSKECDMTRSTTGYTEVLDVEVMEKKVSVLVFDKNTGMLNAMKTVGSTSEECSFSIPVGEKTVWAVVNGPLLADVMSVSQLANLTDNLNNRTLKNDGLVMIGSTDCTVETGATVTPTVEVSRLVSRVVLRSVDCRIPEQYGKITVNNVFLGDAFTKQTFGGTVSGKVNSSGYVDTNKTIPIGKKGVVSSCAEYMYHIVEKDVSVGSSLDINACLYCQPNQTDDYTGLYILATIADNEYYYRVPLDQGLEANCTYTVDIVITNIGEPEPPLHNNEKGGIKAVVTIADWLTGDIYKAEI